jgi:hypothetical protein
MPIDEGIIDLDNGLTTRLESVNGDPSSEGTATGQAARAATVAAPGLTLMESAGEVRE